MDSQLLIRLFIQLPERRRLVAWPYPGLA